MKTRLARDIGTVAATWWFRHQVGALLRRIGDDPRWETWLAVAPNYRGLRSRVWPAHLPRMAQGAGDLGARMGRVFRALPPGPAIIIGADIPGIRAQHLAEAFGQLGRHDAVLGPAPDGGYWLVGLARGRQAAPAGLFDGVRWSSPHALADTVASLRGQRIAYPATLRDVDTAADLKALSSNRGSG